MSPKPQDRGEVFERGPDGKPTDARLWDAMLDGDTKDRLDGRNPEALKRRREEHEALERAQAAQEATPYACFLRTTDHGQEPAGRAVLTEGGIVFEGVEPNLVQEMERGIRVGRRVLTPADGEAFLRALPRHFTGSYLRAAYRGRRSK